MRNSDLEGSPTETTGIKKASKSKESKREDTMHSKQEKERDATDLELDGETQEIFKYALENHVSIARQFGFKEPRLEKMFFEIGDDE